VLAQVRGEIRRHLDPLDDQARDNAEKTVLAALLADASRDATPPAPEPADEAPSRLLSARDFNRKVVNDFPQPIARAYHALLNQDSDASKFGCLLDTFESLVHYMATVSLSAYIRAGLLDPGLNLCLAERFLKQCGNWATGELLGLLRDAVR